MKQITLFLLGMLLTTLTTLAQFNKADFYTSKKDIFELQKSTQEYSKNSTSTTANIFSKNGFNVKTDLGEKFILTGDPTAEISGQIVHLKWKALDKNYKSCEFWISTIKGQKDKHGTYKRIPKAISIFYESEGLIITYDVNKTVSNQDLYF